MRSKIRTIYAAIIAIALFALHSGLSTNSSHAQAQGLQGPESLCPVCTACPSSNSGGGGGGGGGTTATCDYTCSNATVKNNVKANLNTCVGCSPELIIQAQACGMSTKCDSCCPPPTTSCKITSCPTGQNLWDPGSPNCKCRSNIDICNDIAGEVTRVGVVTWHSNSDVTESKIAFENIGTGSAVNWDKTGATVTGSASLTALSPCMERSRAMCVEAFYSQISGYDSSILNGLNSYRTNDYAKYVDTCIAQALKVSGKMTQTYIGPSGSYDRWADSKLLDTNCDLIAPWKENLVTAANCSNIRQVNFNELTSPVSLLWRSDVVIDDVSSRSKFPLNPSEKGKWFVWRASGLSPLVVWDPEHKGSITQPTQLFGNYTFGKSWKNGYEALTSLDKDSNGWLERDELTSIALWFDFNQDGVSDSGEVKTLSEVSVEAIGARSSRTDEKSGSIFADQGFRRRIKDQIVEGRSVDWFSATVEGRLGSEAFVPELSIENARIVEKGGAPSKDLAADFAGVWRWRAVDPSGAELPQNLPSGTFTLYRDGLEVAGTAYVAARLAPNTGGLAEQIDFHRLAGEASKTDSGETQVTFSTKTVHGGDVRSVARLSPDGSLLVGKTTEEIGSNKEKVAYAWVAKRIEELSK